MNSGAASEAIGPAWPRLLQEFDHPEGAPAALHYLAGMLHAGNPDADSQRSWLASVADRLHASRIACFEYVVDEDRPEHAIGHPGPETAWALRVLPLERIRTAGIGDAIVHSVPASDGGETLHVVATKTIATKVSVLAVAHSAQDTSIDENTVTVLAWHLLCNRIAADKQARAARGLTGADLLSMLPFACGLTDAAGRAIERNPAFEEFMMATALRVATGRLRFSDPYLQDSWVLALSEVHATAVPQSILATTREGAQWRVHLIPLRCPLDAHDFTERPMIFAIAEQLPPTVERAFESLISGAARPLTHAETEVLNALLQGHTAKIIATARGASVNTVRSQIMTILEKTGHHNQKSLIAAFSTSSFGNSAFGNSSSMNSVSGVRPSGGLAMRKR